ncbi:carboxypeptidase regulatory-like domain-containing protein [Myxococcaceae bacterium GXIMD 01537]
MKNLVPRTAALLCLLLAPTAFAGETDLGPGFPDLGHAATGLLVASGDGTVRRFDSERFPVVVDTHRKLVGLAVSEDGQLVAAVGAGRVALSSDGGKTFTVEPTPDEALVYAAAFSGKELFLFDTRGRGFRRGKEGKGFQLVTLPRSAHFWTASFSGARGYVVGQKGTLLATADGGGKWAALTSPDPEPTGVLAWKNIVWVSGQGGVYRSENAGRTFAQVFSAPAASKKPADCWRMGGRAGAVVVACSPTENALVHAADGKNFKVVPVSDAANLLSAAISPEGELRAVGAYELFVRATPAGGRLVSHSEHTQRWSDLMAKRRASEEAAKAAPRPSERPAEPKKPTYPVRAGEARVVTGTLRDERGRPVPNVEVIVVAGWAHHGEGHQRAVTDAQGLYRFRPARSDSLKLRLKVPRYVPVWLDIPVAPGAETVVDITLQPEVVLRGSVAATGARVNGGAVTLWPLPPEGADLQRWRFNTARISAAAISSEGTFQLPDVAAGEYLLETHVDGFLPTSQRVRAPDTAVRVKVSPGASVALRVLSPKGTPLEGAKASLSPTPQLKRVLAQEGIDVEVSARTDARGNASLGGLPDGDYVMEVDSGEGRYRLCVKRNVAVRGGETPAVEVRFGAGPRILGRVTDDHGRPVEGAEVLGMAGGLCASRMTTTDTAGTFVLLDVEPALRYAMSALVSQGAMGDIETPTVEATAGDYGVHLVFPTGP